MATLSPSQTVGAKWLCQQLHSKQSRNDSICIEAWLATHCLAVFQTDWFSVHQIWLLTWTGPYNSHIIHAIHVCLYHFKNTNPMILSLQHRNSSVPVITSACRCACAFGHGHCLIARYCWYCSSVDICAQSVVSHTNHIKYIITILYNTRCLDCLMRGSQRRRPKSSLSHETGYPWPTERFRLQNPMKLLP